MSELTLTRIDSPEIDLRAMERLTAQLVEPAPGDRPPCCLISDLQYALASYARQHCVPGDITRRINELTAADPCPDCRAAAAARSDVGH